MLVLTRSDVEALLTVRRLVDAVRRGLAESADGHAVVPPRIRIEVADSEHESLFMPCRLPRVPALGAKVVSGFSSNPARGLPATTGVLLLLDPETGLVDALMEAGHITDVRTAAMTLLAWEHLARPDACSLAVVGAGQQARAHVDLLAAAFRLEEVRVWSRSPDRLHAFVADSARLHPGLRLLAAGSAEAAVRGADVVVAATTAREPVIDDAWVGAGTLVCGVGSHTPDAAEIAPATVERATRVVVDSWAACSAGDVARPIADGRISASAVRELGELVLGRAGGRAGPQDVTVFKGVGFAAADLAIADVVRRAAVAAGVGREIDLLA